MNPRHFENDNLKADIWKMKNIQHGLVQKRRLVSGRVQKHFVNVNKFKLELLGN